MSGIHKSQEIYKYTPTENGRKCIPIRGLYVSGLHTEPWYVDHVITITNFTSSEPRIEDYYESTTETVHPSYTVTGFYPGPNVEVDNYSSTARNSVHPSYTVTGFIDGHGLVIDLYESSTFQQVHPSYTVMSFIKSDNVAIENLMETHVDSSLEHIISIDEFTSSTPSIADL